jgi:hypothetical protein
MVTLLLYALLIVLCCCWDRKSDAKLRSLCALTQRAYNALRNFLNVVLLLLLLLQGKK